ncbi:MAG: LacI family transcriptional regulator [Ruminococcaceae bacterium]|nr:LacI family transcriptional regulator [Oscillospiraceae bacterium]
MAKRVTLKDIAERVGVTSASVSMILNGKDITRFSPELVARVRETAQELRYVSPSSTGGQREIAIISPSVNNPYHTTIIMGIERAALEYGYITATYNTYWSPESEQSILTQLERKGVAGIIYVMNPLQLEMVHALDRRIPIVAVGDIVNDLEIDTVDINNFSAGKLVAEHLIELGHRNIAYLTTSLNAHHIARVRRYEGLLETVRERCPEGSVTVFCKDVKYEEELQTPNIELLCGRELAKQCLRDGKITAIVAINDMVGYGVLDELSEQGKRVPEDYSLCGFDNVFPSSFRRMWITTVDHSTIYHGGHAFHLLKNKIDAAADNADVHPITRAEYKSRLILRGSTTAPRAE